MTREQKLIMDCLAGYRRGSAITQCEQPVRWDVLHTISAQQKLLPVVYEAAWKQSWFCEGQDDLRTKWKQETVFMSIGQLQRSQKLLALCNAFESENLQYVVTKGIVCRSMYQNPDARLSGDEDLYICDQDKARADALLRSLGYQPIELGDGNHVTHWLEPQSGLHIELHTRLITGARPVDLQLEEILQGKLAETFRCDVSGGTVRTLPPTWHMIFLVQHAVQHFITGGVGVRTLCDVVTFAERYDPLIHWQTVREWLTRSNSRLFFEQLLLTGKKYWGLEEQYFPWKPEELVSPEELIADSLDAGIYGQSSMTRKHSAGLVVNGLGQEHGNPLLKTLFPPKERLYGRYPKLKNAPILLPFAWLHRLGCYGMELLRSPKEENAALESVRMGARRTEMMMKYGIIPKAAKKTRT